MGRTPPAHDLSALDPSRTKQTPESQAVFSCQSSVPRPAPADKPALTHTLHSPQGSNVPTFCPAHSPELPNPPLRLPLDSVKPFVRPHRPRPAAQPKEPSVSSCRPGHGPSLGSGGQRMQGETGGRRTTHQHFYLRGPADADRTEIRNITAQQGQAPARSVPLAVPLGVVLAWRLQIMEVEVGHHVPHGQHQPVQALLMIQALGPSVLGPLALCQRGSSEQGHPRTGPNTPTTRTPGPCPGEKGSRNHTHASNKARPPECGPAAMLTPWMFHPSRSHGLRRAHPSLLDRLDARAAAVLALDIHT